MSHIVVYPADDGSSVYEMCSGLDAAVVVAERVRNVEGIESPEIYELSPVPYDFKPYFRVEVAQPTADLSSIGSTSSALADDSTDDPDPRQGASAMFGSAAEDEALTEAAAEAEAAEDAWHAAADAADTDTDADQSDDQSDDEVVDVSSEQGDDEPADDTDDEAIEVTEATDSAVEIGDGPYIPEDLSELPPPPSAEALAADEPEPADEPDPMVSVRRGLFGR